jgi:hypothetical protein
MWHGIAIPNDCEEGGKHFKILVDRGNADPNSHMDSVCGMESGFELD